MTDNNVNQLMTVIIENIPILEFMIGLFNQLLCYLSLVPLPMAKNPLNFTEMLCSFTGMQQEVEKTLYSL